MKTATRVLLVFFLLIGHTYAITLVSSGDWSVTIDATNLSSGAGSDIANPIQSAAGITSLDVTGTTMATWSLSARLPSGSGNSNVTLSLKRSSNGSGTGTISGGTSFIALSTVNTVIFTGTKNRTGIGMQYQLTGLSVNTLPPGTYAAPVIFTVQ